MRFIRVHTYIHDVDWDFVTEDQTVDQPAFGVPGNVNDFELSAWPMGRIYGLAQVQKFS
ncbi:MAG TPA: hypothetical protein VMT53_17630 [Terriglobales bacterium]|nr:hypothetical protein [Terriglobales bacterium]